MGELDGDLSDHHLIGLDTPLFIYALENHAQYGDLSASIFAAIEDGRFVGITSVISLMEISVLPLSLGQVDTVRVYQAHLENFPNLEVVEVGRRSALSAARLRAGYRLRPADALQLAACIDAGATAFITNDLRLRQVQEVAIITLDTYLDSDL